ncbi:FUSC family protein, partial [Bacteroides fragilis]
ILIVLSRYSSFQRFMWIGFAFSSLYSSYGFLGITFKERAIDRILGTILGSALFIVASSLLPSGLLSLSGGFILGICSTYRYKTVFNCFGALTVASSLFGLTEATMMRVIDNMIGVGVALLFIWLTQWYSKKMEWYKDRRKQSLLE